MTEIQVRELKTMNLEGGTVIDGFPSVGLVSTIVSTYLVGTLGLDQIAALDSELFPPLSMIYLTKPKFPARVYASEQRKIAVFVAEFTPNPVLDRTIAKKMLEWARIKRCSQIVTSVGMPPPEGAESSDSVVLGVGSTENARQRLSKAGVQLLEYGIVSGIPGALLNEGRILSFDVMTLLTTVMPGIPNARAAAKLIEIIDRMFIPDIKVDVEPLYREAEKIEGRIKELRTQVKHFEPTEPKYIYG